MRRSIGGKDLKHSGCTISTEIRSFFYTKATCRRESALEHSTLSVNDEMNQMLNKKFQAKKCNIIYKIIAKCIANRLKPILNQLISHNQSVFIPQRLITDNVIIGYKCLHKIRGKREGKKGLVAFKIDISKAYNNRMMFLESLCVEWDSQTNG